MGIGKQGFPGSGQRCPQPVLAQGPRDILNWTLPLDSVPSHWAFLVIPTRAPGSPAGSQPETQSGVSLSRPCPSQSLPREEAALKRMRLSAGLSGCGVLLGFHPPKQAAGRSPPSVTSKELWMLLGSHAFPRPESLHTSQPLPLPALHMPLSLQDGRGAMLPPRRSPRAKGPTAQPVRGGGGAGAPDTHILLCLLLLPTPV